MKCPMSYVVSSCLLFFWVQFFPPWAVLMLSNIGFKLQNSLFSALAFPGACGGKRRWVGKLISEFSCVAQVF